MTLMLALPCQEARNTCHEASGPWTDKATLLSSSRVMKTSQLKCSQLAFAPTRFLSLGTWCAVEVKVDLAPCQHGNCRSSPWLLVFPWLLPKPVSQALNLSPIGMDVHWNHPWKPTFRYSIVDPADSSRLPPHQAIHLCLWWCLDLKLPTTLHHTFLVLQETSPQARNLLIPFLVCGPTRNNSWKYSENRHSWCLTAKSKFATCNSPWPWHKRIKGDVYSKAAMVLRLASTVHSAVSLHLFQLEPPTLKPKGFEKNSTA